MKLLILTTQPRTLEWGSLNEKITTIQTALNSGKNADFSIGVIHVDAVPEVKNGRITHDWIMDLGRPYFSQGYDLVGLHMSMAQWKKWGLQSSLRGANPRDTSEQEDFYFRADERSKREGEDKFTQVCLHEIAHAYYQETGEEDITHEYHDANPDITGLFATFDWSRYQPQRRLLKRLKSLLERLVERLRTEPPHSLHVRLPDLFNDNITQGYGVKNPKYRLTGRHVGVDYGAPVGTPVYAPWNGKIILSGTHPAFGHYAYFQYVYNGQQYEERLMHLKEVPDQGHYRRGQQLAETGNTGMSTGPHLHVDKWPGRIDTRSITPKNWDRLTVNPHIAPEK